MESHESECGMCDRQIVQSYMVPHGNECGMCDRHILVGIGLLVRGLVSPSLTEFSFVHLYVVALSEKGSIIQYDYMK